MNQKVILKIRFRLILWTVVMVLFMGRTSVIAQSADIDSLNSKLTSSTDTSRINFLCELSKKFLTYRPPLSKKYAEEALALSKKIGFTAGEMNALNRLGEYEFRQSNYAKSVEYTTQSLKLAEQLHDSLAMAAVYRVLGNINTFGFKQYDKALRYHQQALAIYEHKKDMSKIASLYGNITWIYAITNKNLKEAYHMAKRGARIADSLHLEQLLSYNYNSLGMILMREEKMDSALHYLDESSKVGQRIMDRSLNAYNNSIKGKIYLQQKDYRKAENAFLKAENESRELNSREVLKESFLGLSQTYDGIGNHPLAFQYLKKFMALKDSLVNWEITQKTLMMEYELEEQRQSAKISELEQIAIQERSEKKIYGLLLIIGVSSFIIILLLIIRNNRQRRKANELLVEKNSEIQRQNLQLKQANEIKDKLFFIIGHDMRGPVANLKSLMGMLERNEVSEEEFKKLTPHLNQQVVGINETVENLLKWSGSQLHGWQINPVSFALFPMIERAFALFGELAARKSLNMQNEVDSSLNVYADQDQIELVVRNLLHNAIKFTPDGGRITVFASPHDEFVEIKIEDTGVGIPEEALSKLFQEPGIRNTHGTRGEKGTGLGLSICYEMIKSNGGEIFVSSIEQKGTTVCVTLKAALNLNKPVIAQAIE